MSAEDEVAERRERRHAVTSRQDALVVAVIALLAIAASEGIILFDAASPTPRTFTQTVFSTTTNSVLVTTTSVSSVYLVTKSTATVTQTATVLVSSSSSTKTTAASSSAQVRSSPPPSSDSSTGQSQLVMIPMGAANFTTSGYAPSTLQVVIGVNNTVTWINDDTVHHTVSSLSLNGAPDSGDLAPGQEYSFTFQQPGTYSFFCVYFPWMHGTVNVRAH